MSNDFKPIYMILEDYYQTPIAVFDSEEKAIEWLKENKQTKKHSINMDDIHIAEFILNNPFTSNKSYKRIKLEEL